MNRMVVMTVLASALALTSLGTADFAAARDKGMRECIGCNGGGGGGNGGGGGAPDIGNQDPGPTKQLDQPNFPDGSDQGVPSRRVRKFQPDNQPGFADDNGQDQFVPRRRGKKFDPDNQFQPGNGPDNDVVTNKHYRKWDGNKRWRYDSNRHQRRHSRDNRFRYYFDGFWYAQPYWDQPDDYYDDGDDYDSYGVSCREGARIVSRRFLRVRIVDCDGRIYTYLGKRRGYTFEIKLNSRTGRIVDAERI